MRSAVLKPQLISSVSPDAMPSKMPHEPILPDTKRLHACVMHVAIGIQRNTPPSPRFSCSCLSRSILSPCLKLHHPVCVISISTPIATNTGPHTSSSSPCKALCVHTLCTVSDHPSSAGPSSCSRHTNTALWDQQCRLSRRGRKNRWCRTAGLSAGHTVRGTW